MRTERLARVLSLLLVLLFSFGLSGAGATAAYAADDPSKHADYGPPKDPPKEWVEGGLAIGIDQDGNYCVLNEAEGCNLDAGEIPGTIDICEGADGTGSASEECSDADRHAFEMRRLEKWRKAYNKDAPEFEKLNKYVTACVEKGGTFEDCLRKGSEEYPPPAKGPMDWIGGKISELASDALKEAANYIGKAVVWLLSEFAKVFNSASTINLNETGIGSVTGIMTALSVVVATFLLLLQFGKVGLSQRGEPAATAFVGLAKWAVISSVYLLATQTALSWSDAISTWIINYTFEGGGSGEADATAAMQQQLGTLFGGLIVGGGGTAAVGGALIAGETITVAAVGVIIVIGIVCILAIAALWIEVLLRQAGIMILVATMPVVLVGQLSDATQEWWPKARNALIALILMKPAIVICFAIGFGAMTEGKGAQNMFVGLVIFVLACFAWPVLAKFMTFSTVGGGSSVASGLISSIGSSASSTTGGYRPDVSGAGAVGGGSGYTQALERDTSQTMASGSNAAAGRSFGSKVAGSIALPLQVLAAGKDVLESGMANTAAHAGLDHGSPGGRHAVIAPRRSGGGTAVEAPPDSAHPAPSAPAMPPPGVRESAPPPAPRPSGNTNTPPNGNGS
ncbi:hypothetical protein ACFYWY_11225 [Streptomyces sp. NPDC002870]|uniref:hypothetical protein n=1 Tax=Streptomyces sp. NPDC002870 TaxID=3364666 RepID=UPI0036A5A299